MSIFLIIVGILAVIISLVLFFVTKEIVFLFLGLIVLISCAAKSAVFDKIEDMNNSVARLQNSGKRSSALFGTKQCSKCKKEFEADRGSCPHCGYRENV